MSSVTRNKLKFLLPCQLLFIYIAGTALGTPKAARANMASSSSAYSYQSQTMGGYGAGEGVDIGGGGGTLGGSSSYER